MTLINTQVRAIRLETDGIISLELYGDGQQLPTYAAGAHIDLHLDNGMIRSYSLLPSRHAGCYRIAILLSPAGRGGSRHLHTQVRIGQKLQISPPRNSFSQSEKATSAVLLAGGIGITPLYSIAEQLIRKGLDVDLIYCVRNRAQAAFIDELEALAASANLRMSLHCREEAGARLDLMQVLRQYSPDTAFYCCGPSSLLSSFAAACSELGYQDVHSEHFAAPANMASQQADDASFVVELARSGGSYRIAPDKSILDVLLAEGINCDYSCREGVCGACETPVLSGEIEHRDVILTEQEKRSGKKMMMCVSRARSAHLLLDL